MCIGVLVRELLYRCVSDDVFYDRYRWNAADKSSMMMIEQYSVGCISILFKCMSYYYFNSFSWQTRILEYIQYVIYYIL